MINTWKLHSLKVKIKSEIKVILILILQGLQLTLLLSVSSNPFIASEIN